MFDNSRYLTCGVEAEIPPELQFLLWNLIDAMKVEEKDCLQIFKLEQVQVGNQIVQRICHTQEQPSYTREYYVKLPQPISGKIYCIDDLDHSTMLLADEY